MQGAGQHGKQTDRKERLAEHFQKHHSLQKFTRNVVVELLEKITVYEGGRIEVLPRYQADFEDALRYIENLPPDSASTERRAV